MSVEKLFHISPENEDNILRLRGAKVAVLGAARSGVAVAKLLQRHDARVLISDIQPVECFGNDFFRGLSNDIEVEFGGHSDRVLQSDLICISPGIPTSIPILQKAQGLGVPIVGELEVASWFSRAPIIAITGSNGKTTTTTLTGSIFKRHFDRVIVGGNIGNPFAAELLEQPDPQICILEVSSFQVETIVNFHPQFTVITNLSPNHLDRYPDFETYVAAKMDITKNLEQDDVLIYNADDSYLSEQASRLSVRKIPFSNNLELDYGAFWEENRILIRLEKEHSIELSSYKLKGPHNRYNMVVAALLSVLNDISPDDIKEELQNFPGVQHRLEQVAQIDGITFVNDSKATTVSSLQYALQSFRERIVLIAGGIDKGGDFAALNPLLKQKVRAAVVIGRAAARMKEAWGNTVPVKAAPTLEDAVTTAYRSAQKGDVVLLSPACSSFDMFKDYEDRGNRFKRIVMILSEAHRSGNSPLTKRNESPKAKDHAKVNER